MMTADRATLRRKLGNVLVATDFSPSADRAVGRALRLPVGLGSSVTLLHVFPAHTQPPALREDEGALSQEVDRARAEADALAKALGREALNIVPAISRGKELIEIVRAARDRRAELIVLGRHGERGFPVLQLGSTGERVIRKAGASVLVVSRPPSTPYRRPLVAVDFSEPSRRALELVLRLMDEAAPLVRVVHACDLEDDAPEPRRREDVRASLARFVTEFEAAGVEWELIVKRGDPRQVIVDASAAHECDLIALGSYGRSGFAHILIGSVAEAVARVAACDVLVARFPRADFRVP
jgi:nucleotide-binding universal stress UspA family protein